MLFFDGLLFPGKRGNSLFTIIYLDSLLKLLADWHVVSGVFREENKSLSICFEFYQFIKKLLSVILTGKFFAIGCNTYIHTHYEYVIAAALIWQTFSQSFSSSFPSLKKEIERLSAPFAPEEKHA